MSFETWVSILLASLAVLLAAVTAIMAVGGVVIAVVGIWGIKEVKLAAARKAQEAVTHKIAEYPQAADFLGLYRNLQAQLAEFKQEYEVWQKRSADASAILVRLNASGSSTSPADEKASSSAITEAISASYPGEEQDSDDNDNGKSGSSSGVTLTDSR